MLHAPAAAALIALATRRIGSPRASWFAALVYLTTPWIFQLAVIPFVEGPLCSFHAACLWAALRLWESTEARSDESRRVDERNWAGLLGLLAGGAMACKYPALISAVVPFGLLAAAASRAAAVARDRAGVRRGMGGHHRVPGWSRTSSTPAIRSIRWPTRSSAAGTGMPLARRNGPGLMGRGP